MAETLPDMIERRHREVVAQQRMADAAMRPDEDFIVWRRNDGEIGSIMRSRRFPKKPWLALRWLAAQLLRGV